MLQGQPLASRYPHTIQTLVIAAAHDYLKQTKSTEINQSNQRFPVLDIQLTGDHLCG